MSYAQGRTEGGVDLEVVQYSLLAANQTKIPYPKPL